MTVTDTQPPAAAPTTGAGRVTRVIGSVIDVEFPSDRIPAIYNALTVDAGEQGQAGRFQATLSKNDLDAVSRPLASVLRGQVPAVFEGVAPYDPAVNEILFGSTDVADVSWITPTVQAWVACYAFGTPMHSWQMVSQGQSALAHAGMVRAARVLTATAIELVNRPELIAQAQAELLERRQGKPYECPIPADVPLPFLRT